MPTKTASKKTAPKKAAPRKSKPKPAAKIPVHQWAHGSDEVFILRFSDTDGRSHGGFQHPMEVGETVTAPDWNAAPSCGGGIHGWPWGIGLGDGKEPEWDALWQVYGVKLEDVIGDVAGGPKCKFRTGVLRYKGDWHGAALFILAGQMAWAVHTAEGAATNSGYRGAATNSGDSGAATNSGDSGAALSTGNYSTASSPGKSSVAAVTGHGGKARAGVWGCIALAWFNEPENRYEMRAGVVGCGDGSDGKLKADIWYRLSDAGELEECD